MIDPIIAAPLVVAVASLIIMLLMMRGSTEHGDEGGFSRGSSLGMSSGSGVSASGGPATGTRTRGRVVLEDERSRRSLRKRLVQAGLYRRNSKTYFMVVQGVLAAVPIAGALGVSYMGVYAPSVGILIGVALGISAIVFPGLWLDSRKKARQTAIRRSLPDALDVIVVCVEAGLSLTASLVRVTDELRSAHPLLSHELKIVDKEVQLGVSIGMALRNFADRFDLEELRSLAAVVQQAEKFGASVSNALRVHAESLRERRLQAAKERAMKATVILLIPTVLCIFPAMFVVILGPAVFRVIEAMQNVRPG